MYSKRTIGFLGAAAVFFLLVFSAAAVSVEELVSQVSLDNYTDYLNNRLYARTGNDRSFTTYGPIRYPRANHDPARENIRNFFVALGLDTRLDPFTFEFDNATYQGCANVVAVHRGRTRPDDCYILGAHYDSFYNPGADDNASGVAALMETARILSQYVFEATLIFIAFDAEEYQLQGSAYYVDQHRSDRILGMVSVDMIAHNPDNASRASVYGRVASNPVKQALAGAIAQFGNGVAVTVLDHWDISDHVSFERAGFVACGLSEVNPFANPNYHWPSDAVETPGNLDYVFAVNLTRGVVGFAATAAGLMPNPNELRTVSGRMTLQDFVGDRRTVKARIELRSNPPEMYPVNLDAAGYYSFQTERTGTFELSAKASRWLRQTRTVSISGPTTVDFQLGNGDVDCDNEITTSDLASVLSAMDTVLGDPAFDSSADLDGDQEITTSDLATVLLNMGQSGDP